MLECQRENVLTLDRKRFANRTWRQEADTHARLRHQRFFENKGLKKENQTEAERVLLPHLQGRTERKARLDSEEKETKKRRMPCL